jgi:hypothetical protein
MRRILWIIGTGLGGFFIGGKVSGFEGSVIGFVYGASLGFGIGSIFDQTYPTKRVVFYWGFTMALVGPFFGLIIGAVFLSDLSVVNGNIACGIGAVVGMLLGSAGGVIHLKRLRVHDHASGEGRTPTTTTR